MPFTPTAENIDLALFHAFYSELVKRESGFSQNTLLALVLEERWRRAALTRLPHPREGEAGEAWVRNMQSPKWAGRVPSRLKLPQGQCGN
ncbi:hypothetical protein ACJ72_01221 [Emergomyces africanus]|uniref:Uncharacterized protein n=1 Tax=Emergomyces africanus TaxID=1955775 RepID=A0A1B7P5W0_9EURO|nr:hypothetical protein ACJ72_01221 [Emergomyces africanus]